MRNIFKAVLLGTQKLQAQLRAYKRIRLLNADYAAKEAADYVLAKAQELVPIDKGKLTASGKVRRFGPRRSGDYVVSFNTPYAVYVHEDLAKVHGAAFNKKYAAEIAAGTEHARRPQEQAKFLEVAVRESRQRVRGLIVQRMKRVRI